MTITFSQASGFAMLQPDPFAWLDSDKSFDDWAKRLGFTSEQQDGQPEGNEYHCYKNRDPQAEWQFLIVVNGYFTSDSVVVKNEAELLALRLKLAPFVTSGFAADLSTMEHYLEKLFRAFHGHDPFVACPKCDPGEYRRQVERKLERTKQDGA